MRRISIARICLPLSWKIAFRASSQYIENWPARSVRALYTHLDLNVSHWWTFENLKAEHENFSRLALKGMAEYLATFDY